MQPRPCAETSRPAGPVPSVRRETIMTDLLSREAPLTLWSCHGVRGEGDDHTAPVTWSGSSCAPVATRVPSVDSVGNATTSSRLHSSRPRKLPDSPGTPQPDYRRRTRSLNGIGPAGVEGYGDGRIREQTTQAPRTYGEGPPRRASEQRPSGRTHQQFQRHARKSSGS